MRDDERPVMVEIDGVFYRGRRSVRQIGARVWIDGEEVSVDVDRDGDTIGYIRALASPVVFCACIYPRLRGSP